MTRPDTVPASSLLLALFPSAFGFLRLVLEVEAMIYAADFLLTGGEIRPDRAIEVSDDGIIDRICPIGDLSDSERASVVHLGRRLILPGAVNSHSHAFQIGIRGTADNASDFRDWVDSHLYPFVLAVDEEAAEALCRLAFAEMIQNGATTVGEFWYIHNAPETFERLGNRFAEIAIRAARDVGMRIHLLRTMYDQGGREGQKRFKEPIEEASGAVRALHDAWTDDPLVSVGPAPHSLHGASPEMIQAGADLAEELDTFFHIHLAEEEHDLPYAQEHYGTTPLRALKDLGVLNERLVIVHGVWLDEEEIGMLGQARGGLAYNPISNAALGDGITDIAAMVRDGVCVSLGTDGACANNGVDVWREMRTCEQLQRLQKLEMGILPALAESGEPNLMLRMGTKNGGRNLGLPIGTLAEGKAADFVALDVDDLSLQPNHEMETVSFLNNVVNAMQIRSALTDVVVGGEFVLKERQLTKVDAVEIANAATAQVERLKRT